MSIFLKVDNRIEHVESVRFILTFKLIVFRMSIPYKDYIRVLSSHECFLLRLKYLIEKCVCLFIDINK